MKNITNIRIFIFLFLSLVLTSCFMQPETGKKVFIMTSESYENQLGTQGYQEVMKEAKLSKNQNLSKILKRVGSRIAKQTGNNGYKWEYKLIESDEINAWCMPGGKIAVYTGILPIMKNEAGMAAVIGHEVAHAILRHAGQRISQQLIVEMGLSATDISLKNSKHRSTILGLLGAGTTVGIMLPYSRTHEKEADVLGLKYMAKAGYDPHEAVNLWKRFSKAVKGAPPEFLSTHPGHSTRISLLNSNMPEAKRLYNQNRTKYGIGERLQ